MKVFFHQDYHLGHSAVRRFATPWKLWLCRTLGAILLATTLAGSLARCGGQVFQELYLLGDEAGDGPNGALIQAKDGNFYGTASDGGRGGYGTVFRITPEGAFTTIF